MAWDIYGGYLEPGHCEVHPHVHEEYPCSICIHEAKAQEEEKRQYEQAMAEYGEQLYREQAIEHWQGQCGDGI